MRPSRFMKSERSSDARRDLSRTKKFNESVEIFVDLMPKCLYPLVHCIQFDSRTPPNPRERQQQSEPHDLCQIPAAAGLHSARDAERNQLTVRRNKRARLPNMRPADRIKRRIEAGGTESPESFAGRRLAFVEQKSR